MNLYLHSSPKNSPGPDKSRRSYRDPYQRQIGLEKSPERRYSNIVCFYIINNIVIVVMKCDLCIIIYPCL